MYFIYKKLKIFKKFMSQMNNIEYNYGSTYIYFRHLCKCCFEKPNKKHHNLTEIFNEKPLLI